MMQTEIGNIHVTLDKPLRDRGLAVWAGWSRQTMVLIDADEMARIRASDIGGFRGMPTVFCFDGDVVRVWPTPDKEYPVSFLDP